MKAVPVHPDLEALLITEEQLAERIRALGAQVTADYRGGEPLLVGVLKGAVVFMADLVRQIDLPLTIDFMAVSSYGASTETSGVVQILKDLDHPVEGRDVLIVEDIVDTGLTLNYIRRNLETRAPASLKVCGLLLKEKARAVPIALDYVGFRIPDRFVVGYGLDCEERYRNLPYVGVLRARLYRQWLSAARVR